MKVCISIIAQSQILRKLVQQMKQAVRLAWGLTAFSYIYGQDKRNEMEYELFDHDEEEVACVRKA
ncbi:hypothetical protein [Brevibacillus sp. 179-C9.3 HS]|uniref:hypothetical protein n=1 Tax=unclassified Brevibacillus TaxID=2684853 RepID=UPI0039A347DA